jgi:hypothetical protein
LLLSLLAGLLASPGAMAQQAAQGFAVERLYPSAPGAAWLVMDDLSLSGGIGGTIALTESYAHDPLRVKAQSGFPRLAVVSDEAWIDVGAAITFDRYRFYVNVVSPVALGGEGGTIGGISFSAPSVDPGKAPDLLSDLRLGADALLLGRPHEPFRLGVGAQLIVPSGDRADYVTDGTYRAMARILLAGDAGGFAYAGHLGVHVRPLDDTPTPGSPRGSELLFGIAAGPAIPIGQGQGLAVAVGPEVFGATAFRSFLASAATSVEGLLTGRLEARQCSGAVVGIKLGTGVGLSQRFGAPEWRFVLGLEVSDRRDIGRRPDAAGGREPGGDAP